MEMNVSPEPEWAKKFQEYLETEYNFSKLDAMGTIGVLHQYMRKYKEPIDEKVLTKIALEKCPFHDNDNLETAHFMGFKEGYREGWEDKI